MSSTIDKAVRWYNTSEQDYPYHGQKVIIEMQDNYAIATFNSMNKTFSFTEQMLIRTVNATDGNVKWTRFKL